MASCTTLFSLLVVLLAACSVRGSAILPVAAPYAVAPFASSYNAHTVHHSIATPVAAAAPYVAAPAHYAAAPIAAAPYVASPYVASPYVASPYVASAAYPYLLK